MKEGEIPNDWNKSYMINVYKGKGDALECGSYRGIKLLEHAMKGFERVVENRLRQILCFDEMQFGFTPGKGTTDAVFILRQMQERYLVKKRDLWITTTTTKHFKSVLPVDNTIQFSRVCTCLHASDLPPNRRFHCIGRSGSPF